MPLNGGNHESNFEKYFTHCQRTLPYDESSGSKPDLSFVDEGLFGVSAEGSFAKDRDEQLFLACRVVPDWNPRS